ncbi:hypothetical protein DYU11_20080 [Fibrisoma montanum]|uniref:Uncharacterized protein n=1 Tax=Fibrisoma montanum TaxID=2305895 RepID=A0A418M3K6_9BACT|nr:hypothetical protein DYU11_20080 [Fibrisoma montanum]
MTALLFRLLFYAVSLLLMAPAPFWNDVVEMLQIPDEVKTAAAPVAGSACWTAVEIIANANRQAPRVLKLLWLKFLVGWITGQFCVSLITPWLKNPPDWSAAFVAGAAGYIFISKVLPKRIQKLEDDYDDD